jgi:hypothetical protein
MARDLEAHADAWERARQLRELLDAYETAKKPVGAAGEWLAAARGYADALDPVVNGGAVARELEPADEVLEQLIAEVRTREKVSAR